MGQTHRHALTQRAPFGTCERLCKSVRAAQIARSGSVTTTTVATQVADHIGGSVRFDNVEGR